jgi:hypothetical protein
MNTNSTLEYLTGFTMGALMGFGLTAIILVIYNLFCGWWGCSSMGFTWWNAIPLPLLLGANLAIAIEGLGLGD